MTNTIIYEKLDSIARIFLNRPEDGNRINRELFLGLDEAVARASNDPEIRVVIIGAKGDTFCSGYDVGDPEVSLNANGDGPVPWEARRANTYEEMDLYMKIYNMRKPVIGAVQGTVLGGGCAIAMMFDCIVAADDTIFDNDELALGMSYTNYTPFEAWKLPMNIAKEKAFTGYSITAEEGLRYGLFNRVVPREKLEETALKLARRMTRLAPYTLTMHKELLKMAYDLQGITRIIPFSTEVFNFALQLPGTPENQAMWKVAKEQGGEAMIQLFEQRLKELKEEEKE